MCSRPGLTHACSGLLTCSRLGLTHVLSAYARAYGWGLRTKHALDYAHTQTQAQAYGWGLRVCSRLGLTHTCLGLRTCSRLGLTHTCLGLRTKHALDYAHTHTHAHTHKLRLRLIAGAYTRVLRLTHTGLASISRLSPSTRTNCSVTFDPP